MKQTHTRLFFGLYFFEGAPIGLIWWAFPTLMASQGVGVATITTFTAAAALPWTFKFLLGPLVDRYLRDVRGHARALAALQAGLLLALLTLLQADLAHPSFFWLLLLISGFAAAQDVVIDAWAIATVGEDERGAVNGAMQAGMLTGRWIFGAGLLIALAHISWHFALIAFCGLLIASILFLLVRFGRDRTQIGEASHLGGLSAFGFVKDPRFLILLPIAVLSGFVFEAFGAVAGPFLIANGFNPGEVGLTLSGTLLTMLFGALVGGKVADAKGARFVFLRAGLGLAVLVSLIGLAHGLAGGFILAALVCLTYFGIGVFTAASYSFYMAQAKGAMEATKFTFLMAMTNLCESLSAFTVGMIAANSSHSYRLALPATAAIGIVGLLVLGRGFRSKI
ncbi:MAG: MFS transporter [Proteobacteria bacterium]|nr:MAG: MFS transporter [Pseudomonadota bacterium]